MDKLTVAVTGASGMVGLHAVRNLAERGHEVIAVVRRSSNTEPLRKLGAVQIRCADVGDREALVAAFAGADVVVHTAGTVDPLGKREEIMAVNVGGTKNCLEAAIEARVKHFVHISSLSVITAQGDQYGVDETAPLAYCGESYADSKVDAEKTVMAEASSDRIKVTALRPGFIYGPGERAWMPRLVNSIATGKAMLIDGGTKETNVIYIDNLCRAIAASLLNPDAFGKVYNLTDGQKVTKKELFDAIADGLELPRVKRSVPGPLARAVCEIVSSLAPYLPLEAQRKLSRLSRAAFRLAGVNQGFDISRAERDLGYVVRIPFSEGMRRTLEHFRPQARTTAAGTGSRAGV